MTRLNDSSHLSHLVSWQSKVMAQEIDIIDELLARGAHIDAQRQNGARLI